MRQPVYDPINGDVGAMFPPNRSGVLPPTKGAPVVGDPMGGMVPPNPMQPNPDDLQRQALVKALTAKIGGMGAQPPIGAV